MASALRTEMRRRQTALYSFYGALAVALIVVVTWWMVRPRERIIPALQRRVTDSMLSWRCPDGHAFQAKGSYQRMACPQCGRRADIAVTYLCPIHGDKPAVIRIERLDRSRERLSEVSFRRGVWRTVKEHVRCPDCGLSMTPKTERPFTPHAKP